MEQIGVVKEIIGNQAIIQIKRKTSCGDSCEGCSAMCKVPKVEVKADLIDDLKIGDKVEVFSENVNILKYSLILYGVPLILMVTVIFVLSGIFKGDDGQIFAALGGLASLILSFFILKAYDKKESSKKCFKYYIKKIDN